MSNALAIATVSAALGRLLQGALNADVPGTLVSHGRPGGPGDDARRGVNIFLYQATPNATLRNLDLPTRDPGSRPVARATAALDLHYLLTFYGDHATFEPERLLGAVARRMHEQAVLTRELIRGTIEDPQNGILIGDSDLADAPELVKFSPSPLTLEELSKIWSILFQTPYRLSTAYCGTVVQLEARREVGPALPVRRRGGYVLPFAAMEITGAQAAGGPDGPIAWGGRLALSGRGFDLPGMQLLIGGQVATVDPATATPTRVEVELVPAALGGAVLPAGVQTARLRLPQPGLPAHLARESAALPFLLRPALALPAGAVTAGPADPSGRHDGTIAVDLTPPLGDGQTARLLLDRTLPGPAAAVLEPQIPDGAAFPLTRVVFAFTDLPAGTWLIRAQVDGAEGALTLQTDPAAPDFGQVIGPLVTIP